MTLYLGIDGGGTKTRGLLGDDGAVLASAASSGSNLIRLGEAQTRLALRTVIEDVCQSANVDPGQIGHICIGAAGAARPDVAKTLRAIFAELTGATVEIVGDMEIALEAAFGGSPGIIAIAGTGSIVFGRDVAGQTYRAGGWGFSVLDEGSGHWIGRHAVAATLRALDRGIHTQLLDATLQAWNLTSIDGLVQFVNSDPPPDFPRLFPLVLHAAEANDTIAEALLLEAGHALANLAGTVLRRMPHPPFVPIATTGSVFRQSAHVRNVFYNDLRASFSSLEFHERAVRPVEGALIRARRAKHP